MGMAPGPAPEPPRFDALLEAYRAFRTPHPAEVFRRVAAAARPAPGGLRVLDVGHGTGLAAQGWPEGAVARLVGVDVARGMLRASPWPDKVRGRAEALPFRAGAFDVLTCAQTFHWLDPAPAWAEFHRVLAPHGMAAVWWKYQRGDDPTAALSDAVIARELGREAPVTPLVRSAELPGAAASPFGGWEDVRFEVDLPFTVAGYVGWQASREYLRRSAGPRKAEVLAAVERALVERHGSPGARFHVRQLVRLCLLRKTQETSGGTAAAGKG